MSLFPSPLEEECSNSFPLCISKPYARMRGAKAGTASRVMIMIWCGTSEPPTCMEQRMDRSWLSLGVQISGLLVTTCVAWAADPPCDTYSESKQARCTGIWKELNKEDGPLIAQFGLDQQKRREEGKINARQHLAENMTFIKQSTEKRIERLRERMTKE